MWKQLEVAEIKCVDDSSLTRGIRIACGMQGRSCVTLIFDKSVSHPQTDELVRQLNEMKLAEIIVEIP